MLGVVTETVARGTVARGTVARDSCEEDFCRKLLDFVVYEKRSGPG